MVIVKRIVALAVAVTVIATAGFAAVRLAAKQQMRVRAAAAVTATVTETVSDNENFNTTARGMCTLDGTGRVLFAKNENKQLPMASTTKIVTALTVLENCTDLDTPFEVDKRAIGIEGTSIYLKRGEKLTVRELLYGMMLRSGNDAATALALHISPTVDEFANLMNAAAIKSGANNSNFKNPHGLDEEGHYTTAKDLSLITARAMKNPTFCEIVATKEKRISGAEYPRVVRNKNRLLNGMANCVGVKTGFTKKAGRCYVGAIRENDTTIICTVLNCGPMFEEAAELMENGMDIILDEIAQNAWYNQETPVS
jgi:D-alanyl-D-alanine carboxypeptidase (penicillin-binding protein 5/6)